MTTRKEKDTMGEVEVESSKYWGAQTQRAYNNFPISGLRMPRGFIRALGLIKATAAEVNEGLGLLEGQGAVGLLAPERAIEGAPPPIDGIHVEPARCETQRLACGSRRVLLRPEERFDGAFPVAAPPAKEPRLQPPGAGQLRVLRGFGGAGRGPRGRARGGA